MVISRGSRYAALFFFAISSYAATPCPQPHDIQPADSLNSLATHYFGSSGYAIAIALATNARTSDGFPYIANPDDLTKVSRVCIPAKAEASALRQGWTAYDAAVQMARLPRADINAGLVTIPPDQPVSLVAWVRKDQADRLKNPSGGWVTATAAETWVTVEPHLQTFCRDFVSAHKPDDGALTSRLEQRLGLAPASSKSQFVRIRLEHPGPDAIFRPCMNPATDRAECPVGPPSQATLAHQQWIFQQYYSSYGQSLIGEFPWTALGYTFDWAPGQGSRFQRNGESEFVIHKGAAIEIQDVVDTRQYCSVN
jgi:hypothetical protein